MQVGGVTTSETGTPVAAGYVVSDEPLEPASFPPAKPSKALLGLLVLNVATTGLVAFKVLTAPPAQAATAQAAPAAPMSAEVTGPVIALDPFVVSLDEPSTSRYLELTLEIELRSHGGDAFTRSKQRVRDTVLSYLSGLHLEDTLGAEARDEIRQDLMAKLGELVGQDRIRRMFFQDFVVQ